MLIGAAVCPGAPFLIAGVADSLATTLRPVIMACRAAIRGLPAADSIVLLAAGGPTAGGAPFRELPVGALLAMTSIRRSDQRVPAISLPASPPRTAPGPAVTDPAVGTMVGAALLDDVSCKLPVTAVEVVDSAAAASMLSAMTRSAERVALLVIADGAACHGDEAPGRRDDRSTGFDAAVRAALAAGSPVDLSAACADRPLASALLASVEPLDVLARLTASSPPVVAELLYADAPAGVGYWVGGWRWTDR
jgi:hypothetical protein